MVIWVSVSRDGLKNNGPIFLRGGESPEFWPEFWSSERRRGGEKTEEIGHNDFQSSANSIDL